MKKSLKTLKNLEYVCVTSLTRYARAIGTWQTLNAFLTHALGTAISRIFFIGTRVSKTFAKRIQPRRALINF